MRKMINKATVFDSNNTAPNMRGVGSVRKRRRRVQKRYFKNFAIPMAMKLDR